MDIQTLFSQLIRTSSTVHDQTVWHATVDVTVLRHMLSFSADIAKRGQWALPLPEEKLIVVRTSHVEPAGEQERIWYGDVPDCPGVQAILVVHHWGSLFPVVSGHIQDGASRFQIMHVAEGVVSIVRVPVPVSHGCLTAEPDCDPQRKLPAAGITPFAATALSQEEDTPVMITVLPVYGTAMVRSYHADAIKGICMTAQAYTNKAFSNSGIEARTLYLEPVYLDAIKTNKLLDAIKIIGNMGAPGHPDDPLYKAVDAAREHAKADVVLMLFDVSDGFVAGVASNIPEPPVYNHSMLSNACFAVGVTSPEVFAHELGHLLGGKHDRITMPWSARLDPAYDYARGYISAAPGDLAPFVTLMGYSNALERRSAKSVEYIPAFSAAGREWEGKPLGIPVGKPDAADAATLFRQSTRVVAAYRGNEAEARHVANLHPLELQVQPPLGGALQPSLPGPYPNGTVVVVRARPRVGYRFAHWTLDGTTVPASQPVTFIHMESTHRLTAHFSSTGETHAVTVSAWLGEPFNSFGKETPPTALSASEFVVTLTPPGPYLPGTHVSAQVTITPKDGKKHSAFCWTIDGDMVNQEFHANPTNQSQVLKLRVERDIALGCYFYSDQ